jgi:hypothetical protein
MRECLLHRECEEDDAHDHRQMQHGPQLALDERGDDDQSRPDKGRGSHPRDGGQQIRVAASPKRIQRDVHHVHDQECDAEDEGVAAE